MISGPQELWYAGPLEGSAFVFLGICVSVHLLTTMPLSLEGRIIRGMDTVEGLYDRLVLLVGHAATRKTTPSRQWRIELAPSGST